MLSLFLPQKEVKDVWFYLLPKKNINLIINIHYFVIFYIKKLKIVDIIYIYLNLIFNFKTI